MQCEGSSVRGAGGGTRGLLGKACSVIACECLWHPCVCGSSAGDMHGAWCMVHHGASWCIMVHHGASWCIMVHHGAWRMAHGAWHMAHGAWRMAHGAWCMAHGAWRMAHGAWRLHYLITGAAPGMHAACSMLHGTSYAAPVIRSCAKPLSKSHTAPCLSCTVQAHAQLQAGPPSLQQFAGKVRRAACTHRGTPRNECPSGMSAYCTSVMTPNEKSRSVRSSAPIDCRS